MSLRPVKRVIQAKPAIEGAGVHLRRAFGFGNTSDFDPFLLLDDFRNDIPDDYLAGFPWPPHRGIETITYVLAGTVEHGDSMGNRGVIGSGDIQWMTAGSGIIHQEMPKGDGVGRMHGFQLWANLPASLKMTPPRYQEVKAPDIPQITDDDGTQVRVVCGTFWGARGPVDGDAHRAGFDEALLLNERREASECTSANLFAVFGDTVATPPLTSGCLPGVTRELLLEEVRAPGIEVVERPLTLPDLEAADGLFVTSSTRDLLGVREIDGLSIRAENRVCAELKKAFTAYERSYVERAPRRARGIETLSCAARPVVPDRG